MAKRATPADTSTTLTIPFAVLVDPATEKIVINLKSKKAVIEGGQPIAWEITNTMPKDIKASVIGLDSAMEKPFVSTVSLKSGEIKRIEGTVKDPGYFPQNRAYAIWLKVGGKDIAVDPDLQVDPPPGGVVIIKSTTTNVPVAVTITESFTIQTDPNPVVAQVDQSVTWTITNQSLKDVQFFIGFPPGIVSFQNGKQSVVIPASNGQGKNGTGTVVAGVASPGNGQYGERIDGEGGTHSSLPAFTFTK